MKRNETYIFLLLISGSQVRVLLGSPISSNGFHWLQRHAERDRFLIVSA